jgi:hypothetical protein
MTLIYIFWGKKSIDLFSGAGGLIRRFFRRFTSNLPPKAIKNIKKDFFCLDLHQKYGRFFIKDF